MLLSTRISDLVSVPKHIQNNWAGYVTVGATTYLVKACWGKMAAVTFGCVAITALPLLGRQLTIIFHYNLSGLAQASTAGTIVALCFVCPPAAAGLAAVLAVHIVKREQTQATIAKNMAQEISTLQQQTPELDAALQKVERALPAVISDTAKRVEDLTAQLQTSNESTKRLSQGVTDLTKSIEARVASQSAKNAALRKQLSEPSYKGSRVPPIGA